MGIDYRFLQENMMGPNAWILAEELTSDLPIKRGMRILDLGCGRGISSIFLAKKYEAEVFAVDLWISATENFARFQQMGVAQQTVPLQFDARQLPFAQSFFDAVVSIDSYHYFGNNDTYFKKILRPTLKKGAVVALAFPGMKNEIHKNIPEEMKPLWDEEALQMWHSIDWWKPKFETHLEDLNITEMDCFSMAWDDWLACDSPYASEDRPMIETDNGRFMNLIKLTGTIR